MSKTLAQKKQWIQDKLDNSNNAIQQLCLGWELTKGKTPTTAAHEVTFKAVASQLKPIQDLLLPTSATFNVLLSLLWQQEQTSLNMSKESYILHSTWLTFNSKALESFMEKTDYKHSLPQWTLLLYLLKQDTKTAICIVAQLKL